MKTKNSPYANHYLTRFSARIRFNWGFWEGRAVKDHGRIDRRQIKDGELFCLPLWDSVYCAGYEAGVSGKFDGENSSTSAWVEFSSKNA